MEKLILKLTALIAVSLLISSCAPPEITDVNGINPYAYVQGDFIEKSDQVIRGTGTVRFIETATGVQSARSVSLKAELTASMSQSAVGVIFNSSNTLLPSNNGVVVRFQRSGINIVGSVTVNGNTSYLNPMRISPYIPASLDLIIEVHNDYNRTRVLVWRRNSSIYAPETADIDSGRSGDVSPNLPVNMGGPGIYMGLQLWNATVTAAQVDLAKITE